LSHILSAVPMPEVSLHERRREPVAHP